MSFIKKNKKFLALLFLGVNLFADPINTSNFTLYNNIYQQGIYDTYNQIISLLNENMANTPLIALNNKIIVAVNIDSFPINKILYYSVIGKKNFFESFTAKNENDGHNYLIFGIYDRKADADYALNILKQKEINAIEVFNGQWYNNNIILKNLVFQLKNGALKNFPVKVIVEKEIIEQTQSFSKPKSKLVSVNINRNYFNKNKNILSVLFTVIGHLKKYGQPGKDKNGIFIMYKNKKYRINDTVEGFKITQAYIKYKCHKNKLYKMYVFRFDNYDNYHLIYRFPVSVKNLDKQKCNKLENDNKNDNNQSNAQNKNKKNNSENNNFSKNNNSQKKIKNIVCDFSKILSFIEKNQNGKYVIVKTATTSFANNNNVQCYWDKQIYNIPVAITNNQTIPMKFYKIVPINQNQNIYIQKKDLENDCSIDN